MIKEALAERPSHAARTSTKSPAFHIAFFAKLADHENSISILDTIREGKNKEERQVIRHLCGCGMDCCFKDHLALGSQRQNLIDKSYHTVFKDIGEHYGYASEEYKMMLKIVNPVVECHGII